MRSLRNVIGTGLAGLVLFATTAAGFPAHAEAARLGYSAAPAAPELAQVEQTTLRLSDKQAQATALTGSEQRFFSPPTSVWVSNGLTQVRGVRLNGTFSFSGSGVTLAGTETVFTNASLDATNNGYTWGWVTYTDKATGLKCTGSVNGKITNALGTLAVVVKCRNGAMLVGRVQDISTDPPNVAPPKSVKSSFDGVLISPGGR